LELKKIHESTLIWYTTEDNEDAKALKDQLDGKVTYAHCTSRQELFDKLEVSIRITLIVSDDEGYNLVRTMMAAGINFNKTICNVIIKPNGNEGDLEQVAQAFKKDIATTADDNLKEVAMAKVEEAFTNVADYTKGRNKKNLKRTDDTLKHDSDKK
jgi:hypothetical protein